MKSRKETRTSRLAISAAATSLLAAGIISPSTATAQEQYFYVVNQGTNMVAEVFAHNTADGAATVLWTNYGGESEQFRMDFHDDGWFTLTAKHSGKCLGRAYSSSSSSVIQKSCPSLNEEKDLWRTQEIRKTASDCANVNQCFGGSRTVLQNKYGGGRFCLDAANATAPKPPGEGAGLQTWTCIKKFGDWNAVNQDWRLVKTQDWGSGPVVR
ncbi:RICIN domain-containing protein [Streptomyces sp. NPDC059957]|uniref:RICIN domain-containing protein n=1 Tax=unclassified Streptomyces TaxID=2593676 RepID=UPI003655D302